MLPLSETISRGSQYRSTMPFSSFKFLKWHLLDTLFVEASAQKPVLRMTPPVAGPTVRLGAGNDPIVYFVRVIPFRKDSGPMETIGLIKIVSFSSFSLPHRGENCSNVLLVARRSARGAIESAAPSGDEAC